MKEHVFFLFMFPQMEMFKNLKSRESCLFNLMNFLPFPPLRCFSCYIHLPRFDSYTSTLLMGELDNRLLHIV